MWVGQGEPRSSLAGWNTGCEAVAVKRVAYGEAALAERDAVTAVRQQVKGRPGPHHATSLLECLTEEKDDGQADLVFITQ